MSTPVTSRGDATGTRVAIVTGASGGIGRAVAERLASDGMAVVVQYAGNPGRAEEVVEAIESAARRSRSGPTCPTRTRSPRCSTRPSARSAVSTSTKGAVDALTPILAKELRGRDVTVNAVAPGPTATPLFLDGKDRATVDRMASMAPLERLGTPDDLAEAVAFLAGPARWVNGQVIYVNGGVA
jgi:NAD(P)-dependent dehydrogenase (short-subunit alcohol dehydrogenase family)